MFGWRLCPERIWYSCITWQSSISISSKIIRIYKIIIIIILMLMFSIRSLPKNRFDMIFLMIMISMLTSLIFSARFSMIFIATSLPVSNSVALIQHHQDLPSLDQGRGTYFNLRDENFFLSISCFETRMKTKISFFQSHASRWEREFLSFSLVFEARTRISFNLRLRDENVNQDWDNSQENFRECNF